MAGLRFTFNARKAAEAASEFTKLAGGTVDIVRLMKLLYLAERRSVKLYRRPIFGDRYVSMKHGPVVSHSYNLLKPGGAGEPAEILEYWSRHFERSGYQVHLKTALAPAALSRVEVKLIAVVHDQWKAIDTWSMVDKLHKELPEWKDPKGSSIVITVNDLCAALSMTKAETDDLAAQANLGAMLQSNPSSEFAKAR